MHRLTLILLVFVFKLAYLQQTTQLQDHNDDDDDGSGQDALLDQWRLHGSELDSVCICHADGCIYIAIRHKAIPFFWAYKIHNEPSTVFSDHQFLDNIWTWYIPSKVIKKILRLKTPALQKIISRRSFPLTRIASGTVTARKICIMVKGSQRKTHRIRWIAYNHIDNAGHSFKGAVVLNGQSWKPMSIVKLVNLMSKACLPSSKLGSVEFLGKKSVLRLGTRLRKRGIKRSEDERKFPNSGFKVEVKMDNKKLRTLYQALPGKQDKKACSVDESKRRSDGKLVVSGETLHSSQDTIPQKSWLDLTNFIKHDSIHRQYKLKVSLIDSEDERHNSELLDILKESGSLQKSRPQQELVSASLKESQKFVTTESTFTDLPEQTYNPESQTLTSPPDTNVLQTPDVTLSTTTINTDFTEDIKSTSNSTTKKKIEITKVSDVPRNNLTTKFMVNKPTNIFVTTKNPEVSTTTHGYKTEHSKPPKTLPTHEVQTTKGMSPDSEVTESEYTIKMQTATVVTAEILQTQCTEKNKSEFVTKTGTEDPSKSCYGLIHRSALAFKRCLEKIWVMQKLKRKSQQSHHSRLAYTKPDYRSRRIQISTQDTKQKKDLRKKTKDEENEHFYYFDGKLRVKDNHTGPKVDAK